VANFDNERIADEAVRLSVSD